MLTIYQASAGAGKTHLLTGQYLKLIFSAPMAFRHVLAVTFTNKATDEMKSRIIAELYNLALGNDSDFRTLLSETYHLDSFALTQRAKGILMAALHDYSSFNISTIDRFIQQVTRAFARDLGLQGSYEIEMDQTKVLGEVVDRLIASLDQPGRKILLDWLLRFADDKIENGGGWQLRADILALSYELLSEVFQMARGQISKVFEDKRQMTEFQEEQMKIIRSTEARLQQMGQAALDTLKLYGLTPDNFKGGKRSQLQFFRKWAEGEWKEPSAALAFLRERPGDFITKTTDKDTRLRIEQAIQDEFGRRVEEALDFYAGLDTYWSAKESMRYFYVFGILMDLDHELVAYRDEKNILLISDATELLSRLVEERMGPFVYEKIGTRVDHYMFDEFQDTSSLQWNDFYPLVTESLASGNENLVVGDVKQSIYRFRNADWELLDHRLWDQLSSRFARKETLAQNWRSGRHIVEFNNGFFEAAADRLQTLFNKETDQSILGEEEKEYFRHAIQKVYSGCQQQVPENRMGKWGHVAIHLVEEDKDAGQDWEANVLRQLPTTIERLLRAGYAPSDIAILVRTNREAAEVVDALLQTSEGDESNMRRFNVVSDDALFIGRSPVVQFLVALLRYMRRPTDRRLERLVAVAYQTLTGQFGHSLAPDLSERLRTLVAPLAGCSLYEQVEELARHFEALIPASEHIFLQAFLDMALEFGERQGADLSLFLDWWTTSGARKTIAAPEGQDAVRVLTIHKSKGLGFRATIIPFADWDLDHSPMKSVVLWAKPQSERYERIPALPVRYGKALGKTCYAYSYFEEKARALIDNLNLLYVAFTRCKDELIVFCPAPREGAASERDGARTVADLITSVLAKENFREENLFELGEWPREVAPSVAGQSDAVSMRPLAFQSLGERLRLKLRGRDRFIGDVERKHGILMHDILSKIHILEDAEPALADYLNAGIIDQDEAIKIGEQVASLLAMEEVAPWYDGHALVLNETDILLGGGHTYRPDRVMIEDGRVTVVDYKFGQYESPAYRRQVRVYIETLRHMGYPTVQGFLFYVAQRKVVPVSS